MISLIFALALISVVTADVKCEQRQGKCYNYRQKRCWSEMVSGLCGSDQNRKCCMPCPDRCKLDEHIWFLFFDEPCLKKRGICQYRSNYCPGQYANYKCGGPPTRHCCLLRSRFWKSCFQKTKTGRREFSKVEFPYERTPSTQLFWR